MNEERKQFSPNEQLILYSEVEGVCPNCPKTLMYEKNGQNRKYFEIAHIYPLNPTPDEIELLKNEDRLSTDPNDLRNLICLCVSCHSIFDKPRTVNEYRDLVSKKKKLIKRNKEKALWNDTKIEKDILEIIEMLTKEELELNNDDILSYNPKKIDDKANQTMTVLTKRKIHSNVRDYFHIVKSKFIELDNITPLTTETISTQIKTHYLVLCKEHKEVNQNEIFEALVNWLSKRTNQDSNDAAEIVISYFVQNCEVF